jgi:translation initiation factor eIF-2B subunit delta
MYAPQVAHEHRKPVLVLCESYKFHERVQLDSITHNELGDPEALATVLGRPDVTALALPTPPSPMASAGGGGADQAAAAAAAAVAAAKRPGLLNLKYDAMPADYVTAIVTEFGLIPPSSVPVILRECRGQEN